MRNNDWPKSQNNILAYVAVDDFGENLLLSTLYQYSSVITAESNAIYQAIRLIQRDKIKTVTFSDSFSVLKANGYPFNNKWIIINKIRHFLVKVNNIIKIHWIPSHIGIAGNEKADIAAKYNTLEETDIRHYIAKFINLRLHQMKIIHPH